MQKLVILLITLLLNLGLVKSNYASGPGAMWFYYRVITLSPATPAANFQVKITLAAGQYTGMKSDGSDLRFYDDAGNNCQYWIETWNNTGTSTIWVKVPNAGADVLAMYYGNSSATVASNGSSTFDFFDDFDGTTLGSNWASNPTNGSITVSGGVATVSCTNSQASVLSPAISSSFTPASASYYLETKHKEPAYKRNRFYATTSSLGVSPLGYDYGYFTDSGQTTAYVFWSSFPTVTSLTSDIDYLTQWQITNGSTYNWNTYLYSNGVAVANGSRTATFASNIRYLTIGVTEVAGTSTKVDWVRVRQYTATAPAGTVGSQASNTTPSNPLTFTSSGYFIVPDGVTSITVECWGAGGRGGTSTATSETGGGGGGAYSKSVLTVNPGGTYNVNVGTGSTTTSPGGDTYFNTTSAILAKGGNSCADNTLSGASGGASGSGVGNTKYSGGSGATGVNSSYGGGGGSSAGTFANGNNGSGSTGGTAPAGGGNGGNGSTVAGNGNPGSVPGGGGGGVRSASGQTGGSGANGKVIISWCVPPAAPAVTTPVKYCLNATATSLTATGAGLLWYTAATGGTGSATAPTPSTTLAGTTSYYVSQTLGCESARVMIDVIVSSPPATPTTTGAYFCPGNPATLSASGAVSGDKYNWYNSESGGTLLQSNTTNSYTTPNLTNTASYWVSIITSAGCESNRTLVTATVSNPLASVTGQTNITCFDGNNGTITVSASGGQTPYTFSVDNGDSWLAPTGTDLRLFTGLLANTAYKIRVKDVNNCTSPQIIP